MKMQPTNWTSLLHALSAVGDLSGRSVVGADASIPLGDLVGGTALYSRGDDLRGRSVLVATTSQLTTASALIELDGVARRIVLCPPDLPIQHLPFIIETAEVDAIVSDQKKLLDLDNHHSVYFTPCSPTIVPRNYQWDPQHQTEWILLTSGTTGRPKMVVHTLASLAGAIDRSHAPTREIIWSTFYDIRRYGGLQIFLRAILSGRSLILSSSQESIADFLTRAASNGVTHISGTPSQWRRALMSPGAHEVNPEYIRLSGEVADQVILNHLKSFYPKARVDHAFASTEAGVAFEVRDGMAGFPAGTVDQTANVEMNVVDHTLRIRSPRTASRYLGPLAPVLKSADGFVDTGDIVELREGRYYFVGRRDGIINVGGLKVYPEEVEAVINRHPEVQMSLVKAKKNPVTGALVVADVVLTSATRSSASDVSALQNDILLLCRATLSTYKVPAIINFVPALAVAESGKMVRQNA